MSEPASTSWSPPSLSVVTPQSAQQAYQASLDAGRQQGYQEGLQQGLAEGRKKSQTLLAEMSAIWEAMQTPFLDLEEEVQTQLLGLCIAISRAVIERELSTDETAIRTALFSALGALADADTPIKVIVNPIDRAMVEDLLGDQQIQVEFQANPNMMRGGCQLRRAGALVDASIESRLMQAIETLALEQNAEIPSAAEAEAYRDRPLDPDEIAAIADRFTGWK